MRNVAAAFDAMIILGKHALGAIVTSTLWSTYALGVAQVVMDAIAQCAAKPKVVMDAIAECFAEPF